MSDELTNKVNLQIEEILKKADKPELDVNVVFARASEILKERLPIFLTAIVTEVLREAMKEQLAKYGRDIRCRYFIASKTTCRKGKMVGGVCLSCDDYKPVRWWGKLAVWMR